MFFLLIVSFIWAFSFGLIKGNLAGIDSNLVSFIRMFISLLIFIPFLRLKGVNRNLAIQLFIMGMVQYGLMYISYIYSYQFLKAYQVAIFTIFTPLYVTLINDVFNRRFHTLFLLSALLAIAGTAIIVNKQIGQNDLRTGFLIMQISNICFAVGQVWYKKITGANPHIKDSSVFALLYGGAALLTLAASFITVNFSTINLGLKQILTLVYLGVIASGVCFFLWNYGARKTNIGALAIFNNMKIPLGVACSLIFFGENGDIPRLITGGTILLAALVINELLINRKLFGLNGKHKIHNR